jgi:hypothetical protein
MPTGAQGQLQRKKLTSFNIEVPKEFPTFVVADAQNSAQAQRAIKFKVYGASGEETAPEALD